MVKNYAMTNEDWYNTIKYAYSKGYYTDYHVFRFVPKRITEEQFEEITGKSYEEFALSLV